MNKRSGIRATGGVVAATAVALMAVQGSSADAGGRETPVAEHTTVCAGTQSAHSLPGRETSSALRLAIYTDKRGGTRHKSVFTSVSVDERGNSVSVYRIPSKAFDADICGHAEKGVKVRIHDSDVTRRQLSAMVDRVGDDMDRWDGRFALYTVGLDGSGHVVFGVDDRATAEPILKKAFGKFWAKHILVEHTGEPRLD
ncbi:hypothetical protein ABZX90_13240 [Streptomyces sp. NPDC002935]|uniref:hypothetical protein n=1 Tax=Streptomyces sp. NPDC002935 TaxID=3154545 RepID=UPI0033BB089A